MFQRMIVTLALLIALQAVAQNSGSLVCSEDRFLSSVESFGFQNAFFLDEHTILVAGYTSLITYDITDPTNITQISELPLGSRFESVDVDDGYAYISDKSPNSLTVVDVRDASAMSVVSQVPIPASGSIDHMVTVENQIVYVAASNTDLWLYDVSDPASPVLVDEVDIGLGIDDMKAAGSLLFIRSDGLYIYDFTDPLLPIQRSSFDTPNGLSSLDIDGTTVYGRDGYTTLIAVDVSDPDNPMTLGQIDNVAGFPSIAQASGDRLYFAGVSSGIYTIDISDPSSMSIVGQTNEPGRLRGLAANQTHILSVCSDGLKVIDAGKTVSPPPAQVLMDAGGTAASSIDIEGSYAYVANNTPGVTIFDITDPLMPINIAFVPTSNTGYKNSVRVDQGMMYIATGDGVEIFDVSDPFMPSLVGEVSDNEAVGLDILDDRLAIYSVEPGFVALYDISDPAHPMLMDKFTGPEYPNEVVIRGDYIYVAGGYSTLVIIDASDPTNLTTAGIYDAPGIVEYSCAIALSDDTAFVATDFGYIYSIDISDPMNPAWNSDYQIGIEPTAIEVVGDQMVVSLPRLGSVHLLDVSDTSDMSWVAGLSGYAQGLKIDGTHMYAAASLNGFWVLDIGECNRCAADLNLDGELDFFDISFFLKLYLQSDPNADLNEDHLFDFFDISLFLTEFTAGCP